MRHIDPRHPEAFTDEGLVRTDQPPTVDLAPGSQDAFTGAQAELSASIVGQPAPAAPQLHVAETTEVRLA